MMRNLSLVNNEFIIRKYDLKGSKHNRRTLNYYDDCREPKAIIYPTLKDLDFIDLEKSFKIHPSIKQDLINQLKHDSDFFKSQNIIDYSLFVSFVDHGEYKKHLKNENNIDKLEKFIKMENNPSNRLCIIPNTELEGVLVNIIWLGLLSYRNNRLLLDMEHTEGG